ncbi:MAG: hypothetical protein J2P17_03955 [Mycobacterium sp.]|nr:hypothetical protein [Mycobacterium sp.]
MSRRRIVAVIGAASLAVGLASAAAAYAARPSVREALPASARGAILGHLHVSPAQRVIAHNLPQTRSGLKAHMRPALGRNGKPAGSGLPSRPSTGTKPGARGASSRAVTGPKIIDTQFNGIALGTSDCGCQPPDSNATIGPNAILETVNLEFAVYSKTGSLQFRTSLNNFLGTPDGLSDPRAVYDPTWNRWEFSLTDTSSPSLWLVYSQTSDPLGAWWIYHVGFPFAQGSIVDYPQVGMNDVSFFYTSNNFDPNENYLNSTAFSVPKARVYNGFGWGAGLPGVNFNTTPAIVGGYPTQQTNATFMLSPGNNVMNVYAWTNTAEAPTLTFKGAINYTWSPPSRRVNQPGTSTTLDPLDGRIVWAVAQLDGRLWFAHGVDLVGFPAVNYGFVAPGNMTIHVNTAFHSATSDDFNPSISVTDRPDGKALLVVNWAYTDSPNNIPTTTSYASTVGVAVPHLAGGPYSSGGGITSEFRFGDYSSVWPEYNTVGSCAPGEEMLVTNEYFAPNGTWRTRLARVHGAC